MKWGSGSMSRLARLDAAVSRFEAVLCVLVIGLEVAAFSFWIALKGLSTRNEGSELAGLVFRGTLAALAIGILTYRADPLGRAFGAGAAPSGHVERRHPAGLRSLIALAGAAVGIVLAWATKNVGVSYFANWINWLQDASCLTLLGGLRGVGTELTWWLAMLGGSLATGGGKHIHVDVLLRFIRPPLRLPAVAVGWVAAALVCLAAVWGFFDHIAIESFGAPASASPSAKVSITLQEGSRHAFLLRKQIALDLRTSLHVLVGQSYDGWLDGAEWNRWVRAGGWESYFPPEDVRRILMPDDALAQLHPPMVVMPSGGTDRGLIARDLHLIFPFGLLIIGLRFLLRAALALGNVTPPPDEYGSGREAGPG